MDLGVLSSFASILMGEDRAACVNLIAFLMSHDCYCSVTFPHRSRSVVVVIVYPDHTYFLYC